MEHRRTEVAGAPAWIISADHPARAGARGTVLFYHGLSAAKETNEREIARLAARGYLAVGLDCVGHGERRYPDFARRFDGPDWRAEMLAVVEDTAEETHLVIDALLARGWARPGRVGLAGISMGACVVYSAIRAERRVQAAVALLGTPAWFLPWATSPHLSPAAYFPTALLSQNAGADEHVPVGDARAFHERLRPYYAAAPGRERYIEHPGIGHFPPEDRWEVIWEETMRWFDRFIADAPPRIARP